MPCHRRSPFEERPISPSRRASRLPFKVIVHNAAIGLCLFAPVNAFASGHPSFNCAKAKSAAEKAICADTELADADAAIAASIIKAGKILDSHTGEALGKDEQYFIRIRDQIADQATSPVERTEALRTLLSDRLKFLNSMEAAPSNELAGEWRNVSGGVTIRAVSGGKLEASIDASDPVQGKWACQVKGSGAPSDNSLEISADNDVRIDLTRAGTQPMLGIDVMRYARKGPQDFCSQNGSIEGWYFKVRAGS